MLTIKRIMNSLADCLASKFKRHAAHHLDISTLSLEIISRNKEREILLYNSSIQGLWDITYFHRLAEAQRRFYAFLSQSVKNDGKKLKKVEFCSLQRKNPIL